MCHYLQGWIKGINSETLSETNDLGHDGNPLTGNPNAHFAKDAFGYLLTYFEGDYQSIGTSSFLADKTNSDLLKARNDLFNGNISAMVTTIVPPTINGSTVSYSPLPQGTSYKYDQLNRLIEMKVWQNIDAVNNVWGSGLVYNGMYHNKFTYDGNGNIETQQRHDASGNKMDDLVYNYLTVNGKEKNNRLYFVDDDVTITNNFTDDIDDQEAGNYGYDEIGNLIRDDAEEIAEIKWTVSGKVKEIVRTASSTKSNLKFDYDATGNRVAKHVYNSAGVWEKSEFYARDAQGNVMSIYGQTNDPQTQTARFVQTEKPIYGSARIGTEKTEVELIGTPPLDATHYSRTLSLKHFEGVNHLSNTLTIFTDRKIPIDIDNDGIIDEYWPHVVRGMDYYPFGIMMYDRTYNQGEYDHGFMGMHKDDEIKGVGKHYTTEFREYDPRVGRWWSPDPVTHAMYSPYSAFDNNPIYYVDPEGADSHGENKDDLNENKIAKDDTPDSDIPKPAKPENIVGGEKTLPDNTKDYVSKGYNKTAAGFFALSDFSGTVKPGDQPSANWKKINPGTTDKLKRLGNLTKSGNKVTIESGTDVFFGQGNFGGLTVKENARFNITSTENIVTITNLAGITFTPKYVLIADYFKVTEITITKSGDLSLKYNDGGEIKITKQNLSFFDK